MLHDPIGDRPNGESPRAVRPPTASSAPPCGEAGRPQPSAPSPVVYEPGRNGVNPEESTENRRRIEISRQLVEKRWKTSPARRLRRPAPFTPLASNPDRVPLPPPSSASRPPVQALEIDFPGSRRSTGWATVESADRKPWRETRKRGSVGSRPIRRPQTRKSRKLLRHHHLRHLALQVTTRAHGASGPPAPGSEGPPARSREFAQPAPGSWVECGSASRGPHS